MLIASQCEHQGGMHINADNLFVEILRDNEPVAEGEMGEVVVTDLHNYGMPFIRYKNGDLATAGKQSCPCGRGLPLIADVEGRVTDMITTADGRIITGLFFPHLMKEFEEVEHFQVVQETSDRLLVKIVQRAQISNARLEVMRSEIQKVCGDAMKIEFDIADEIPLTPSGKRRVTISKVPTSL